MDYLKTTINWQNMEISTDSWNSLTLPFKVVVKLHEFRNAETDTVCMIWHGIVENSLNWEAQDKGFILESSTYLDACPWARYLVSLRLTFLHL